MNAPVSTVADQLLPLLSLAECLQQRFFDGENTHISSQFDTVGQLLVQLIYISSPSTGGSRCLTGSTAL